MKSWLPIVLFIFLAGTGYFFYNRQQTPKNISAPSPQAEVLPINPTTPLPTDTEGNLGSIEGSLSYPSEAFPPNLTVCAETTEGVLVKCTGNLIKDAKYTYGTGYRLQLTEGSYYVYAYVPGLNNNYHAYYNDFVVCGLSVDCPSHQKIVVGVQKGQTLTGIDPQDWYDNP